MATKSAVTIKCPHCGGVELQSRGRQVKCMGCKKFFAAPREGRGEKAVKMKGRLPCPRCGSYDTKSEGINLYCKTCRHYSTKNSMGESAELEYGENYIRVISSSPRIKSPEDVVKHFKINLDEWRIDKIRAKTSEGYRKDRRVKWKVKEGRVTEGDVDDSGKMLVVPMYHMEVLFVRKTEEVRTRLAIQDLMRDAKKKIPTIRTKVSAPKDGYLLEVDFPDLHFGKLTWAEESGENYDVKIASKLVQDSVAELLGRANGQKIGRILLPLGNDFFNVDNPMNETAHGTKQQEDTRWQKTFRLGRQLAIRIIEGMAQIAPVDVLIIPGNHDETRMFYLGDVLEVKYENDPHVMVNNLAMKRKYYRFGDVLLGLTHGYHEKYEKLAFIMSTEMASEWATTRFREWHLGDKHHRKDMLYGAEDLNGVTIRLLRSLSATDAWHFDKGFVGAPRGAEAFLWDAKDGLVAQYHTTAKKGE